MKRCSCPVYRTFRALNISACVMKVKAKSLAQNGLRTPLAGLIQLNGTTSHESVQRIDPHRPDQTHYWYKPDNCCIVLAILDSSCPIAILESPHGTGSRTVDGGDVSMLCDCRYKLIVPVCVACCRALLK